MNAEDRREIDETFTLPARAIRALEATDNMSPELRACVHEFGFAIVHAFVTSGITTPRTIRRLVQECWMGARQPAQRNRVGRSHSPVLESLDWVMIQAGSEIGAKALLRVLWENNMVIVPREPSSVMVEASMKEVSGFNVRCTTIEKHKRRLRAAIAAQAARLWPHLFGPNK